MLFCLDFSFINCKPHLPYMQFFLSILFSFYCAHLPEVHFQFGIFYSEEIETDTTIEI